MDNELIDYLMSVGKMDRGTAENWADNHSKGWRTEPRNEPIRHLNGGESDDE
ncbi:hypothetical protein [Photobacterium nomapromontoriensis]|uniref:hypothetical protein n=1 Tax=Photobacterium nomapromontoriensis TaxID=2910237 RepID=UPI003D112304